MASNRTSIRPGVAVHFCLHLDLASQADLARSADRVKFSGTRGHVELSVVESTPRTAGASLTSNGGIVGIASAPHPTPLPSRCILSESPLVRFQWNLRARILEEGIRGC